MKRYHYFSYYAPARATTKSDVRGDFHRFRDPYVLLNLGEVLSQAGYKYGTIIANVPQEMQESGSEHLAKAEPALRDSDLLVVPTRSPLSENNPEIRPKRSGVRRSFLPIEIEVFAGLSSVFRHLDRERATLADRWVKQAGQFGEIQFHQNTRSGHTGGCVLRLRDDTEPRDAIAVGYVATVPSLKSYPCRLLTVFGMGGFETLVLSYILREYFPVLSRDVLATDESRILIVSFAIPKLVTFPSVSFQMRDLKPKVEFDSAGTYTGLSDPLIKKK